MDSYVNSEYPNSSNNNEGSYMYSLTNIIQESNSYYQQNLIDAFQNLRGNEEDFFNDQDFDNDNENDNDNDSNNDNSNNYNNNNEDNNSNRNNSNISNTSNSRDTSTINSNDLCFDASLELAQNLKKDSSQFSKDDQPIKSFFDHKRIPSAPLRLLNEFEEFKYSAQYTNLEQAFQYGNKLILIKSEGRFDIESEEGNEICREFLHQIEALIQSFNIKGNSRDYRKRFSKAYIYLFDEDSLCYLTEILDSAQEATPYLVVNGEKFTFSKEVLDLGNQLFASFCSLIFLLTETVNKLKEELFYDNIKEIKTEIKKSLLEFDKKWVLYEEKYINELIHIEESSRRFIIEGIEIEKELTQYETRACIKGKLLIKDKEYNKIREKFVIVLNKLNKVANIEGKGRDDLIIEILIQAEIVLCTVSDGKSKGMRNLALSIKESLLDMRNLLKKFDQNIEGIDPQLRNNPDLSDKLLEFETKWEKGKEYLLNKIKYSQLLFFSQMIEVLCEKYSKYQIHDLIEERDPSIFVTLPCILLLKSIDNEDKGICEEYIPNIRNNTEESGQLFTFLKNIKEELKIKGKGGYSGYNLLEKVILFDGTNEQNESEREIDQYFNKEKIQEFKTSAINLSMHLQRYKPCEWNNFFELAMNIK